MECGRSVVWEEGAWVWWVGWVGWVGWIRCLGRGCVGEAWAGLYVHAAIPSTPMADPIFTKTYSFQSLCAHDACPQVLVLSQTDVTHHMAAENRLMLLGEASLSLLELIFPR
jgi:hypothetical protein